jgi:hypothetical protein
LNRPLFPESGEQDLWTFRRIRYGGHYLDEVSDVTLINWPQVDYWLNPLVGVAEEVWRACLSQARELTLCFVHWLQTDAPRPDSGAGYPGMRLCPQVVGTHDGHAAAAYVRESRRIAAEFTVLETMSGWRRVRALVAPKLFPIPSVSAATELTFIPVRRDAATLTSRPIRFRSHWAPCSRSDENLLAAGKCLGVTHVTNGCYRLHPGGMERRRGRWRPRGVQHQQSSEPTRGSQQPGPAR